MTTLAFKATYSDWKLIKTRGVVQVVMEVPLADAHAAYEVLGGMPDYSSEIWFAIAPLKGPQAEKETLQTPSVKDPATPSQGLDKPLEKAKRMDWRELQPAAQCGIRCDDPVFQAFLREEFDQPYVDSSEQAAEYIRGFCAVKSRSELGTNHKARVLWKILDDRFQAWQRVGA